MLKFLDTFKTKKIAVLGDMRELGSLNESEHNKIYQETLKIADTIISVGPETKKILHQSEAFSEGWFDSYFQI